MKVDLKKYNTEINSYMFVLMREIRGVELSATDIIVLNHIINLQNKNRELYNKQTISTTNLEIAQYLQYREEERIDKGESIVEQSVKKLKKIGFVSIVEYPKRMRCNYSAIKKEIEKHIEVVDKKEIKTIELKPLKF